MATDLTAGKPDRVLWKYSLPLFGSIVFQQLYNIADSVVAGRFIGENALAAVGNSYEVTLIYLAFAFGLNIGVSVVAARLFGAKTHRGVENRGKYGVCFEHSGMRVAYAAGLSFFTGASKADSDARGNF